MGWYGQKGQTRAQLIRELTLMSDSGTCILHTDTACGLWQVWQLKGGENDGKRIICLDLIEERDGYMSHKPMDETMGPCYYDCPLAYLEAATSYATEGYSAAWREKVRAHWAAIERESFDARDRARPMDLDAVRQRMAAPHSPERLAEIERESHSDADPGL